MDNQTAVSRTSEILESLSQVRISVPGATPFGLLEKIERIPRTGKAVRIDRYHLELPKQSLMDHIKMLSFLADGFKSVLQADVDSRVLGEMAAFHDLAEVITGDVPDFTDKGLAGASHMAAEDKIRKEKSANSHLASQLPDGLRESFLGILHRLDDAESAETRFFFMLDKAEPIIAVWRYICLFRDMIEIENYLEAMADFFTNPKPAAAATREEVAKLISFLQNKKMLRQFYFEGPVVFTGLQPNSATSEIMRVMLNIDMDCI